MLETFFTRVAVPEFLKPEFAKDDWYLVIAKLKGILEKQINQTELRSSGKNLSVNGKVYIGSDCVIGENVVIDGPVYIGEQVEIGPGAYIRPGSVIGDKCSIGHAAEVKNAVMMEGSKVANHCFLGDSIIGANARLGGHCETANRHFVQSPIEFCYEDIKLATGLDKLGMILGENSRLGGGVFTAPGSMIGMKTFVGTMSAISGFIPAGQFVKTDFALKIVPNNFNGELKHTELFERV